MIAGGDATTPVTWLRVGVNYVVPFLVSSIGYLAPPASTKPHAWPQPTAGPTSGDLKPEPTSPIPAVFRSCSQAVGTPCLALSR